MLHSFLALEFIDDTRLCLLSFQVYNYVNQFILLLSKDNKLLPSQHFTLQLVGQIFRNLSIPKYIVSNPFYFWKNLHILCKVCLILHNNNLWLWVVSNVCACLWTISRVHSDWKVMTQNTSKKCKSPIDRIESNNIYSCVLADFKSD